jgi:hypothetical protein
MAGKINNDNGVNRFDKTNKCEQMKIKLASYVVVLFTILVVMHKQRSCL